MLDTGKLSDCRPRQIPTHLGPVSTHGGEFATPGTDNGIVLAVTRGGLARGDLGEVALVRPPPWAERRV